MHCKYFTIFKTNFTLIQSEELKTRSLNSKNSVFLRIELNQGVRVISNLFMKQRDLEMLTSGARCTDPYNESYVTQEDTYYVSYKTE